jgi:hypothetical protein
LRELDHPCAAREAACEIGRTPNRQAGLADTTWPGEADQAGPGQLPPKFCKLAAAADEARRLGR